MLGSVRIRLSVLLVVLFSFVIGSGGLASASGSTQTSPTSPALNRAFNWTQSTAVGAPTARSYSASAYDVFTQSVVVFGGWDGSNYLNDTWTLSRNHWVQQHPATSPSAGQLGSMAYYPTNAGPTMLLFGGGFSGNHETWTWDGSNWTQRFPVTSPPDRWAASLSYIPATNSMLLFGGANSSNAVLSDTWMWDGTNWTQQFPSVVPPARAYSAMDYDAATGDVVMFGGSQLTTPPTFLNDTWLWNGSLWIPRTPTTSPSVRAAEALVYDPVRQKIIIFGGAVLVGTQKVATNETWEWNGNTWIQMTAATPPAPRFEAAYAYNVAINRFVVFGGYDYTNQFGDTWFGR